VSCEARRDALLLRAGDALEPGERAELDAHLATGCPRCAGALAEAEAVLAHLGLALTPVAPPAPVRERLLARVANYRDRRTRAELRVPRSEAPPRASRVRSWLVAAGSAAAGALVAFGATQLAGEDPSQVLERQLSARAAEIAALERAVVDVSSALDVLRASKLRVISLAGPKQSGRGNARIYWDWRTGGCYLYATNVRPPPPGHVYRLWFTSVDEKPLPGGSIEVKPSGEATLLTKMPMDIDLFGEVFITLESTEPKELPTGALVLSGRLEQR
jgi:hypothetical protein